MSIMDTPTLRELISIVTSAEGFARCIIGDTDSNLDINQYREEYRGTCISLKERIEAFWETITDEDNNDSNDIPVPSPRRMSRLELPNPYWTAVTGPDISTECDSECDSEA